MKFVGTVTNRTEQAAGQGHSQVRISGNLDVNGDGAADYPCELIISTPSYEIIDAFRRNQEVSLDLQAYDKPRATATTGAAPPPAGG